MLSLRRPSSWVAVAGVAGVVVAVGLVILGPLGGGRMDFWAAADAGEEMISEGPEVPASWRVVEVEGVGFSVPEYWAEFPEGPGQEESLAGVYYRPDAGLFSSANIEVLNGFDATASAKEVLDSLPHEFKGGQVIPLGSEGWVRVEGLPGIEEAARYEFKLRVVHPGADDVAWMRGLYQSVRIDGAAPLVFRVYWHEEAVERGEIDTVLGSIRAV
ncbi:hypothetical protein HNR23_000496 [Nocardiopsis mwathae]|uniref:Uncharacterized protein n=1 Tax=Nocardiopsis mwathae TaxID=1472723 RepID=A0A7X0D470_9ACTN|nr:hypothetical protein [Nocardiopsis mwathae]MBB6170436.1 hypothetical protein [Nocardiopsis mwathae]